MMERAVWAETAQVRKGLPRTRKKRRLEEGRSRVTLRSLKEDTMWRLCESAWVLSEAEMVRSALKIWWVKTELEK